MRDRLIALMRTEGLTAAKLAEITQVQPSTVSHIMAGRNNPGYDFLAAIIRNYPLLNARWLMLGEGDMYNMSSGDYAETALHVETSMTAETIAMAESTSNDRQIELSVDHAAETDTSITPDEADMSLTNNGLTVSDLPLSTKKVEHIDKIVFFNSDGTFTLYHNSDI